MRSFVSQPNLAQDHGFAGINVPKKFRFSFWTSRESICPVHLVAMRGDYGQMLLLPKQGPIQLVPFTSR